MKTKTLLILLLPVLLSPPSLQAQVDMQLVNMITESSANETDIHAAKIAKDLTSAYQISNPLYRKAYYETCRSILLKEYMPHLVAQQKAWLIKAEEIRTNELAKHLTPVELAAMKRLNESAGGKAYARAKLQQIFETGMVNEAQIEKYLNKEERAQVNTYLNSPIYRKNENVTAQIMEKMDVVMQAFTEQKNKEFSNLITTDAPHIAARAVEVLNKSDPRPQHPLMVIPPKKPATFTFM